MAATSRGRRRRSLSPGSRTGCRRRRSYRSGWTRALGVHLLFIICRPRWPATSRAPRPGRARRCSCAGCCVGRCHGTVAVAWLLCRRCSLDARRETRTAADGVGRCSSRSMIRWRWQWWGAIAEGAAALRARHLCGWSLPEPLATPCRRRSPPCTRRRRPGTRRTGGRPPRSSTSRATCGPHPGGAEPGGDVVGFARGAEAGLCRARRTRRRTQLAGHGYLPAACVVLLRRLGRLDEAREA